MMYRPPITNFANHRDSQYIPTTTPTYNPPYYPHHDQTNYQMDDYGQEAYDLPPTPPTYPPDYANDDGMNYQMDDYWQEPYDMPTHPPYYDYHDQRNYHMDDYGQEPYDLPPTPPAYPPYYDYHDQMAPNMDDYWQKPYDLPPTPPTCPPYYDPHDQMTSNMDDYWQEPYDFPPPPPTCPPYYDYHDQMTSNMDDYWQEPYDLPPTPPTHNQSQQYRKQQQPWGQQSHRIASMNNYPGQPYDCDSPGTLQQDMKMKKKFALATQPIQAPRGIISSKQQVNAKSVNNKVPKQPVYRKMTLNDLPLRLLVDTGASRSCIFNDFYQVHTDYLGELKTSRSTLTGPANEPLHIIGDTYDISVKVPGRRPQGHQFVVLSTTNNDYDGILGLDLLAKLDASIHCSKRTLKFNPPQTRGRENTYSINTSHGTSKTNISTGVALQQKKENQDFNSCQPEKLHTIVVASRPPTMITVISDNQSPTSLSQSNQPSYNRSSSTQERPLNKDDLGLTQSQPNQSDYSTESQRMDYNTVANATNYPTTINVKDDIHSPPATSPKSLQLSCIQKQLLTNYDSNSYPSPPEPNNHDSNIQSHQELQQTTEEAVCSPSMVNVIQDDQPQVTDHLLNPPGNGQILPDNATNTRPPDPPLAPKLPKHVANIILRSQDCKSRGRDFAGGESGERRQNYNNPPNTFTNTKRIFTNQTLPMTVYKIKQRRKPRLFLPATPEVKLLFRMQYELRKGRERKRKRERGKRGDCGERPCRGKEEERKEPPHYPTVPDKHPPVAQNPSLYGAARKKKKITN